VDKTRDKSVYDIAKWFIQKDFDEPRNNFKGNMKLQKLLYFAQLIHIYFYDELLFDEPIRAFKNGPVVECIRLDYKNHTAEFIRDAKNMVKSFNRKIMKTLITTVEIFGDYSAEKLSELSHQHDCWERTLKESKDAFGYYHKDKNIIPIEELKNENLENIAQLIKAKEMLAEVNHKCEVVHGVEFYYDPDEIEITDELMQKLKEYKGEDRAFTIYKDPSQGLVIY